MIHLHWFRVYRPELISDDFNCVYEIRDDLGSLRAGQSGDGSTRITDVIREFGHLAVGPLVIWAASIPTSLSIDGIEKYIGEALKPRAAIRYPSVEPVPCSLPPTGGNALSQFRPAHQQMFGGIGNILSSSQPAQNALSDDFYYLNALQLK